MKCAVVIPTYNRRTTVGVAIDSVLAQQALPPGCALTVIVVDDGSTDGTVAALEAAYAGRPVKVLRNLGAKGPAGGRNTGLAAAADCDAVALLDSDDRFLPHHLAEALAVLQSHPGVGLVFGRARYLQGGRPVDYMGPNFDRKLALAPKQQDDGTLSVFGPGFFSHLLEQGCWFNLSSVVLSAAAARERMREDLRVAEDYEFWLRLSRRFGAACLKREQIEYTLGEDNISFESDARVEGHAPQLLRAYDHMLHYEGLTAADRARVHRRIADELFDWAWRARQRKQRGTAARLHLRSMRHGRRTDNLLSLLKCLA
ncbi:glycosyltransferase family 2 protein [Rubrivivax albus]|uniref:Glycosyltransferase family 2 protein n=1 Tax=Rubrivivax albus TaxID=2499835 RepID=A0A437JZI1_9BURK|nr:glycosyltransferase family 2 protein [Rubrivivax albus]RVT53462.1 glycosyltransferase family 2 protein [Rubrivivax albus]